MAALALFMFLSGIVAALHHGTTPYFVAIGGMVFSSLYGVGLVLLRRDSIAARRVWVLCNAALLLFMSVQGCLSDGTLGDSFLIIGFAWTLGHALWGSEAFFLSKGDWHGGEE